MLLRSTAAVYAAGLVLTLAAPAMAQSGETASVVAARGGLRGAIAPSTLWEDVGPGARVKTGDTLKTAAGASAELLFGDGGRLALGENAIVKIQDLDGLGGRVLTGRARVTAPPEGITTLAAGNLRLSGTDAEAIVEKAGSAWRVAVLAGTFRVAEAGRAPVSVEAGRSAIFGGGATEPRYSVITRGALQDLLAGFGPDTSSGSSSAAAPRATSSADKWIAAGLSALLPGSGQLYAGELPRGLLYLGAEFALLGTGFYGVFNGQRQLAMYAGAGLLGLNLISPIDAVFTIGNGPVTPAPSAASLPTSLTATPAEAAAPLFEIRPTDRAAAFRP